MRRNFYSWLGTMLFICTISAVETTVTPASFINTPPVVVARKLVGSALAAARMVGIQDLRERRSFLGQVKFLQPTTVHEFHEAPVERLLVRVARHADVEDYAERVGAIPDRRWAEPKHVHRGNVVRRSQAQPPGQPLGKLVRELRAQLPELLAVAVRQAWLERAVQHRQGAPEEHCAARGRLAVWLVRMSGFLAAGLLGVRPGHMNRHVTPAISAELASRPTV